MLLFLFSMEELKDIFDQLGYEFSPEVIARNIEYYTERTSHGSTLSWVVHAWVLSRRDRLGSWQLFERALNSDFHDLQGGTTAEGLAALESGKADAYAGDRLVLVGTGVAMFTTTISTCPG